MIFKGFTERGQTRLSARGTASLLFIALCALYLAPGPAAQSGEYIIGAQDVLTIIVWEHEDLSGTFSVEADGTISCPLIGRTKVAGQTVQTAERTIEKLLANGFVKKPQVRIAVEKYRSQRVFVMGHVRTPGEYPFTGELTLLEALARAGGATERAGSEVLLVRPAETADISGPVLPDAPGGAAQVTRIDLEELQRKGAVAALELRPRDTIFVPEAQKVFVSGQVARPGEYPIRTGTTLLQALSLAGGVTDRGSTSRVQVVRVVDGREKKLDIKLNERVYGGDTIIVRERFF